ncbi:hypothetical protein [Acutalibacter muris]|nr:hypothetical protein [Acutalibacter muris]
MIKKARPITGPCLPALLPGCRSKPATTFIIGDGSKKELLSDK